MRDAVPEQWCSEAGAQEWLVHGNNKKQAECSSILLLLLNFLQTATPLWPATRADRSSGPCLVCHCLGRNYFLKDSSPYHFKKQLKTKAFFFIIKERIRNQMVCHKLADMSKPVVGPGSADPHLPQDDKDSENQTTVIKPSRVKTSASAPCSEFNTNSSYSGKDWETN